MYIVCAPKMQVNGIIALLDKVAIKSYALPLIDFEFAPEKLKYLEENINSFDYVMLSSPSVINISKDIIAKAVKTKFITVGARSANEISKYTMSEVIYPENSSGRDAVLEGRLKFLDFTNKKVLIVKGDSNVGSDYSNITKAYPTWSKIELYHRISLNINEDELSVLLGSATIKGIIITTSNLVANLFDLCTKIGCREFLQKELFIVIHPQIAEKLRDLGITNIRVTKSANKEDLVNLIKSSLT